MSLDFTSFLMGVASGNGGDVGGGVEITDITLNTDGTYTVTDKDNNTHTLEVTETDGQITAITYDGDNVPLSFTSGELIGVGDTDIDVSRYKSVGRLPAEYQEVEYIESTGTQYIDTGLYLADFKELYSEIAFTQVDGTAQYNGVYGKKISGTSYRKWAIGVRANNKLVWQYPSSDGSYELAEVLIPTVNQKYKVFTSVPFKSVRIKNIVLYSSYVTIPSGTDYDTFLIGARNNSEDEIIEMYCQARFFDWIFYDYDTNNEMTEIAHFIPCYRKADNEIGMYDLVTETFLTNQGTGTFLKGGDV